MSKKTTQRDKLAFIEHYKEVMQEVQGREIKHTELAISLITRKDKSFLKEETLKVLISYLVLYKEKSNPSKANTEQAVIQQIRLVEALDKLLGTSMELN